MSKYTLTENQYEELYKEVMLFAEIGGVTQDEDVIWNMCIEEMKELNSAMEDLNPADILDAVADTFVTISQLQNLYFKELGCITDYEDVEDIFTVNSCIRLLEMRDKKFLKTCMRLWYTHATLEASRWGFNLYKVIKAVNKSNFTKYPTYEEVVAMYGDSQTLLKAVDECVELAKQYGKDYPNVVATVNTIDGVDYVVFRQDHGNGKIVKHFRFFKEPDFTEKF